MRLHCHIASTTRRPWLMAMAGQRIALTVSSAILKDPADKLGSPLDRTARQAGAWVHGWMDGISTQRCRNLAHGAAFAHRADLLQRDPGALPRQRSALARMKRSPHSGPTYETIGRFAAGLPRAEQVAA